MSLTLNTLVPFLTSSDPGYSSEGGLDPLGLYAIADSLAVQLVPGVRERMSDPRYLTLIAIGHVICDVFNPDEYAVDDKSPPWQVYEWYVVEGLVRHFGEDRALQGLSGVEKARTAVRNKLALSASNYLKTAYVFGFHGNYKRLGEALGIFDDTGLLETGWALIDAWEQDQGLPGFHAQQGKNATWRNYLQKAIRDGLDKGSTTRKASWQGWHFIGKFLAPNRRGKRELKVLQDALYGESNEPRHQVLGFLVTPEARTIWEEGGYSERRLHELMRPHASSEVQQLLDAIAAYETFARLLQDAFDDCLFALTRAYGRQSPKQLGATAGVQRAVKEIGFAYESTVQALESVGEHTRFVDNFSHLSDAVDPGSWTELLMTHHVRNQSRKPPNGKNPWFDRFDDGAVAVRAGYTRDTGGYGDDRYVHSYRSNALLSFAQRLSLI